MDITRSELKVYLHIPSTIAGAVLASLWMGTSWYIVDRNQQDKGTMSVIKAMQSDDSRLVTVTFADGSQLLRVPPQGLGPATVPLKKPQRAKETIPQ
jgi:hypothetical protein